MILRSITVLILGLLLVGCGQNGPANSNQSGANNGQPGLNRPTPFQPQDNLDASPQSTVAYQEKTSGALWVRLFAAEDSEVSTPNYLIQGAAPAETVVTVNEEIIVVGSDQTFAVPVLLEDGPNLIEVVASDPQGEEVSFLLTVTLADQPQ